MDLKDLEHTYYCFRKAQSDFKGHGFRMPKNFEEHLETKMKEQNKKKLINITRFFKTKWSNIDPYNYFRCGFELWKSFSYIKFLDPKILKLYISRDKIEKRKTRLLKESMLESALYIKRWMKDNNVYTLQDYIKCENGNMSIAVQHYRKGKIDNGFFVFLLTKGLILNNNERNYVPYIAQNYRKIRSNLEKLNEFTRIMEEKINEYRT